MPVGESQRLPTVNSFSFARPPAKHRRGDPTQFDSGSVHAVSPDISPHDGRGLIRLAVGHASRPNRKTWRAWRAYYWLDRAWNASHGASGQRLGDLPR